MSMLVAPYSPRARAKANTVPAKIPWRQAGILMRQNMKVLDNPRVLPLHSKVSSKLSKAPRAVRYMRGKATTAEARMPPYQVITNCMPNSWRKRPTGCLSPKTNSRSQPQTVGGSTRGRVNITSNTALSMGGSLAM